MCEQINQVREEKEGFLQKLSNQFAKKEAPFTAESCFIQSKYGEGSYKLLDERIKDKQAHIRRVIKSKFAPAPNVNLINYSSYHAVIDIEEDLINYTDAIFKPFIDAGFDIINLTQECKSVIDDGIYLVSWKNAFKK